MHAALVFACFLGPLFALTFFALGVVDQPEIPAPLSRRACVRLIHKDDAA